VGVDSVCQKRGQRMGLLVGTYHGLRGEGGKGVKRDEPTFGVFKSGYQDGK
jgi:hypothetical protein